MAGISGDRLLGAAFAPLSQRLQTRSLPDYLIVSYDRLRSVVVLAEFLDGAAPSAERVIQRTALKPEARRPGWIGANIDISGLKRRVVVGPSFEPSVRTWSSTRAETKTVKLA